MHRRSSRLNLTGWSAAGLAGLTLLFFLAAPGGAQSPTSTPAPPTAAAPSTAMPTLTVEPTIAPAMAVKVRQPPAAPKSFCQTYERGDAAQRRQAVSVLSGISVVAPTVQPLRHCCAGWRKAFRPPAPTQPAPWAAWKRPTGPLWLGCAAFTRPTPADKRMAAHPLSPMDSRADRG